MLRNRLDSDVAVDLLTEPLGVKEGRHGQTGGFCPVQCLLERMERALDKQCGRK